MAAGARQTDATKFNLNPNPNFFSGGTAGDITTFVPKASPSRPDGDFKSVGIFDAPSYEDGHADASTMYPTGWGKWTKGCSNTENFNGDMLHGVGPFSLAPGESMTIVMATVAGYRLEGIQKAVRAARWAYSQNYNIPVLPPVARHKGHQHPDKIGYAWSGTSERKTDARICRIQDLQVLSVSEEILVDRMECVMSTGIRKT